MSNVVRIGHICIAQTETVLALIDGKRSSVNEVCATCGKASTWIVRASDRQIIAIPTRVKR